MVILVVVDVDVIFSLISPPLFSRFNDKRNSGRQLFFIFNYFYELDIVWTIRRNSFLETVNGLARH
jgi:hypothetical protein